MSCLIKWIKHGQQQAYGDYYYVAELHTSEDLSDKRIMKILKEPKRLPKKDWLKYRKNKDYYFRGWYVVTKTDYGYLYEGFYPLMINYSCNNPTVSLLFILF